MSMLDPSTVNFGRRRGVVPAPARRGAAEAGGDPLLGILDLSLPASSGWIIFMLLMEDF